MSLLDVTPERPLPLRTRQLFDANRRWSGAAPLSPVAQDGGTPCSGSRSRRGPWRSTTNRRSRAGRPRPGSEKCRAAVLDGHRLHRPLGATYGLAVKLSPRMVKGSIERVKRAAWARGSPTRRCHSGTPPSAGERLTSTSSPDATAQVQPAAHDNGVSCGALLRSSVADAETGGSRPRGPTARFTVTGC